MSQSSGPLDPLLMTIVLATLAIGLPIVIVLLIRFLWDRNVNIGRSKELEKLIWQLHRIASALEHQMNLSFPPVQPGTEEPRDLVFLKQTVGQPVAASPNAAASTTHPVAQPANSQATGQETTVPPPGQRQPSAEAPRHGGVNSMFGLEP